ncbi:MAG: TolC family protein [Bacteroidetes bacterium]|uniref:TolC family protein n=1 Tax=Flavobacterium sp. TaxID=239 RepID=UPI002FD8A152|nr:TolC family protein [Bacteroidota bacterium]
MKKNILLLFIFLSNTMFAQEQKQTNFTLQEAIDFAIQNNYKAINASRDIEMAKQKKWETTASGLPQITGGLDYNRNFVFQQQGISGNAFNPSLPPDAVSTIAFGTKNSMIARATLSQLIFDGSYIVALQASKTYLKYFENSKVKTTNDVREMVTNYYGNVLLAKENNAILNRNKATLEKNLFEAQQTFNNGLIEEETVEQLQITLASVNNNLSNITRLEDISTKMLKITMGLEINDPIVLTQNLDDLVKDNMSLEAFDQNFNVTNNIDYLLADNFKEQRRLEYKLQKAAYLPSLAANVNLGYNAFSNEFTFANKDQKWNYFSFLGVSLNVPIFKSFGTRAKIQQAKLAYANAQTQLTEAEQMLKLQFETAKSDYEFSIEEYATSKSNLKLAEKIEGKQQIKFKEGISTSFEFTEAQRQLYTAQQNFLQSMINVINKKTALDKVVNKQ